MTTLVTENQLDEWVRGNAQTAQGLVVELVWRLVAASCPRPRDRRFPLSDSIGQHGPDGYLDTPLGFKPFVPEGKSVWEIGTSVRAREKASEDYDGITKEAPLSTRVETDLVLVTPLSARRTWEHTWKPEAQADWLAQRRSRDEWRNVHLIDGTKLIDWLHQFLPVELWLAGRISGVPTTGLELPEQRWNVVRSFGEPPPLLPEVFLADRGEACAALKGLFEGTSVQVKLTTHYPGQVINFVAAYIASLDHEVRGDAAGRSLLVLHEDSWATVCSNPAWRNLVLVADTALELSGDRGTILIQKARRSGHAVIFGGPQGGVPDPASVPLRNPRPSELEKALTKAGYSEERARTLARKSDGNLSSLLRCIQNLSLLPEWAEATDAAELAIASLLGSWSDDSSADRTSIEEIVGKPYGEWIGAIRDIALRSGTPLIHRDRHWKFVARYEGWYALGSRLFDDHLKGLQTAAVSVLQEEDPQFELAPEERYIANLRGKVLRHSHALRAGLAESLALLGSHPDALTSCSQNQAEATAVLAVRGLLSHAGWVQWASLDSLLPLLAEAAPKEFLSQVEEALHSTTCPFDELFAQEGDRNYVAGLLWALETLAWDGDLLSRVVLCLGELAARDPGRGNWANRPINSLVTILLPWLPQTCAPVPKRLAAVRTLLAELPGVGWKLLLSSLPSVHSVSYGTRKPAWRQTIPEHWRQDVLQSEYSEQVTAYADLAIKEARSDASRMADLVEQLPTLPPGARKRVLDLLGSRPVATLPETERLPIWTALTDLVTRHRRFAHAQWAMSSPTLNSVAAVAERLAPASPALHHRRLFTENDLDLFEEQGDLETELRELEARRERAVEEVAALSGPDAVVAFAGEVHSPWRVGLAFGAVAAPDADNVILPHLLTSDEKARSQFAGGFVGGRFRKSGWGWVDSIHTSTWDPSAVGQLLSFLPFVSATWERAETLLGDDQCAYWSRVVAGPSDDKSDLRQAAERFIECDKPLAAVQCLFFMLRDPRGLDGKLAVRALLEFVKGSEHPRSMDAYEIIEIIKALQESPNTDLEDMLRVEWALLPLLDEFRGGSPKFLWRRLADDPYFFCQTIRLVYRSKNTERPSEEPADDVQRMAKNAYELLSGWRMPPGLRDDGTYDGTSLDAWLDAVKKECSETGHLEVAMITLGHVLTYAPPDPAGLWIHRAAAAVLNANDAKDIRDGFRTQVFNSRGAHWVDPTAKPEKDLAAGYREKAEAAEVAGYPRLAATLRDVATEYEREAERVVSSATFDE